MYIVNEAEAESLDDLNVHSLLNERIKYRDTVERIKRRKYSGYRQTSRLDGRFYGGDRTSNKPILPKETKVKQTLQREVIDSDYRLRHQYDFETELAILLRYRYIMVSRKPRLHTIPKRGGEE